MSSTACIASCPIKSNAFMQSCNDCSINQIVSQFINLVIFLSNYDKNMLVSQIWRCASFFMFSDSKLNNFMFGLFGQKRSEYRLLHWLKNISWYFTIESRKSSTYSLIMKMIVVALFLIMAQRSLSSQLLVYQQSTLYLIEDRRVI